MLLTAKETRLSNSTVWCYYIDNTDGLQLRVCAYTTGEEFSRLVASL